LHEGKASAHILPTRLHPALAIAFGRSCTTCSLWGKR